MNDNLCMEYAQNRIDLKILNQKIKSYNEDVNWNTNISDFRDNYYTQDFNPLYDASPEWKGWVTALTVVGDYSSQEMGLAKLLDQKKEIFKQAGIIKRRICSHGRGLINKRMTPCKI